MQKSWTRLEASTIQFKKWFLFWGMFHFWLPIIFSDYWNRTAEMKHSKMYDALRDPCLKGKFFWIQNFEGKGSIFNFRSVFHSKPYLHQRPPRRLWDQKIWNFLAHLLIYVKSLPHHAPLSKRPRKSLKLNFRFSVPMKSVRVRYY